MVRPATDVYAYLKVTPAGAGDAGSKVSFSVPTGNFGDILAGYYAKRMGLPVKDLLVATNENDILHRFFTRGEYHKTANLETLAPSMDICVSSNFERYLYHLCGDDSATLKGWMTDFESTGKLTVQGERLEQAREVFKSASVVKAAPATSPSSSAYGRRRERGGAASSMAVSRRRKGNLLDQNDF